jgi:hypothetical protein
VENGGDTEIPGVEEDEEIHERTYQVPGQGVRMNLRRQPRKEYNLLGQNKKIRIEHYKKEDLY